MVDKLQYHLITIPCNYFCLKCAIRIRIIQKKNMNTLVKFLSTKHCRANFTALQNGYCSIKNEPLGINSSLKFEVTKNPDEWKFVERLLPPKIVPTPKQLPEYPSGWKPQSDSIPNLPYFVSRTKNHMIPVYLHTSQRGIKRHTYVRHIEGDIWQLHKDILDFLQQDYVRPIRSQVNELAKYVCLNGDHVNAIKYYLMKKNF